MAEQTATAGLDAALKEQARLTDSLTRATGTSSEFAAFARLQAATHRVNRWSREHPEERAKRAAAGPE